MTGPLMEVGIIFLEERDGIGTKFIVFLHKIFLLKNRYSSRKKLLNFNQYACSYLLLQLNRVQKIFQFDIINAEFKNYSLPHQKELEREYDDDIRDWFDKFVIGLRQNKDAHNKLDENSEEKINGVIHDKIGCWIGITSESLPGNLFSTDRYKKDIESKSKKNIALVTTDTWERSFSPPSLFEYVMFSVLKYAILSLENDFEESLQFDDRLGFHDISITRGCIYDQSWWKEHRRYAVSTPNLCIECISKIKRLDRTINEKSKEIISLYEVISKVHNKDWMGKPDKRNTPLFNLKKDYKYDLDRNSGLYKNPLEKFRDSVLDNLPQWIIGTAITGIVGGLLVGLGLAK